MRLKVCGLREQNNVEELLKIKPDYLGLNFYKKSERYCSFSALPDFDYGNTTLVGVFVNASISEIEDKAKQFKISVLQLHGNEKQQDLIEIRERLPALKIIKVFGVEDHNDLKDIQSWDKLADYFLFDKKAISFGGTGLKFDWDLLSNRVVAKDFFLAGGIGPRDARALRTLTKVLPELYAVDINSQFEDSNGLKDVAAIKKFQEELNT